MIKKHIKHAIVWCFFTITYKTVITQDPVAIIPQGRIVGIKVYAEGTLNPIEIFFGVPYAIPPVGRYRFAAPERHTGWRRSTFFANRMPPLCPQVGYDENNNISEDCLFLNIWTSRRADGKSLPVLVFFYSETWLDGGISLPCQNLAAEGVVVVTVSYRLHLLAFFTLKSSEARGNLALLDQYLALLWIRDNIAAFGGDPTSITLAGHSAGADSILYHLASPRSVGLFQRAIIMSPKNPWKILEDNYKYANVTEKTSREVAQIFGCEGKSDKEIVLCMRARPLSDIMTLYSNASWGPMLQPIPDDFLSESEQYLPTPLTVALSSKQSMQLDLLLGATDLESINYKDERIEELIKQSPSQIHEYTTAVVVPKLLQMLTIQRPEALSTLIQAIIWEYWGTMKKKDSERNSHEAIENLARVESAAVWGAGNALLAARLARRVSRLFVYRYSQSTKVDLRGRQLNYTGAIHGSDLLALLGDTLMLQVARRPTTNEEKQISALFQHYIIQFVKYGSPARDNEWIRYKVGDAQIHDIVYSRDNIRNKRSAARDISFWLQYLPQLANLLPTLERTEQLKSEKDENRLRGGVFAMCGVSVVLLALLIICVVLLRREQMHRSYAASEMHH
ncbi:acetylcholinesterase [Plodia interpunctella]|nr:acetylcholinesterase [Plodia interpunctella]XP_053616542.1 acetylcholinesterase [Plodia interpunctella]